MSKLMEQYDEKQEAASHSEIIEVTVVAYTEHGVVVDTGQKTEVLMQRNCTGTPPSASVVRMNSSCLRSGRWFFLGWP